MVLDVLRSIGRRWFVAAIGLLLTAGLVFGAYKSSPPEYNARALVLLLPSRTDVGPGGNPLLQLSGLEQPASILAGYFSSAPAREDVKEQSATASYEVALDDTTRGPVLAVDVTDESAADAMKVLNYLLDRIPQELTRLQEDVEARRNAFVGSMVLTIDRQPETVLKGTVRVMVAAIVAGVVSTGFAAVALDGFLLRRQRRRRGETLELEPEAPRESESPPAVALQRPASTAVERPVVPAVPSDEVADRNDEPPPTPSEPAGTDNEPAKAPGAARATSSRTAPESAETSSRAAQPAPETATDDESEDARAQESAWSW